MEDYLRKGIGMEQILPHKSFSKLHEQLLEAELVHPLESVEELVKMRIGEQNENKRCFARVTHQGGPTLTAGIYTALVDLSDKQSALDYADIPGNINLIKNLPMSVFNKGSKTKHACAVLYTISSAQSAPFDKGGRPLARAVYEYLHEEAQENGYELIVSTLSPVRKLLPFLDSQDFLADESACLDEKASDALLAYMSDEQNLERLKHKVIEYLITQKDLVLNFHLGNGAYIGDIKFNPENATDPVMINYVYPSDADQLEQNAAFYQDSKIRLMAPHLAQLIGPDKELQSKSACITSDQNLGNTQAHKPAI